MSSTSDSSDSMPPPPLPEDAWREKGGTKPLGPQLDRLCGEVATRLQRNGVEELLFPDRAMMLHALATEDPQDPASVAQQMVQRLRTLADNPALAMLKRQAQKAMTEEELRDALENVASRYAFASDAFQQGAHRIFEEELESRDQARGKLARLSEAIRHFSTREELEAYLQAQPDFPLKSVLNNIMMGQRLQFLYLDQNVSTATFSLHFKQPLEELVLLIQRLCKEQALQRAVRNIERSFQSHWMLDIDARGFICDVDAPYLVFLWDKVYDRDMSAFCAHMKPACEDVLQGAMGRASSSTLLNETFKISMFSGMMDVTLQLQEKPGTTAAGTDFLETIIRKVILHDIIHTVPAFKAVLQSLYLLTHDRMHIRAAEEILPLFLHQITPAEWDSAPEALDILRRTPWSTMAMQVAVRQHVPSASGSGSSKRQRRSQRGG